MRHPSSELPLTAPWIAHDHATDLAAMSAVLDAQPVLAALIQQDLEAGCAKNAHRKPANFRSVRLGVRRAVLRRFPYGVFCAVGDDRVTVLAVVRHRRSPTRSQQPPAG